MEINIYNELSTVALLDCSYKFVTDSLKMFRKFGTELSLLFYSNLLLGIFNCQNMSQWVRVILPLCNIPATSHNALTQLIIWFIVFTCANIILGKFCELVCVHFICALCVWQISHYPILCFTLKPYVGCCVKPRHSIVYARPINFFWIFVTRRPIVCSLKGCGLMKR